MSTAFIGLDLAKSVFQVHGVDAQGKVVVTKRLRRDAVLAFFANLPVCVVGMEACAGSHFWAREIARLGHTVRLMAPQYVKPYVKRQKNDRADAEAICEESIKMCGVLRLRRLVSGRHLRPWPGTIF
jgi:transposase